MTYTSIKNEKIKNLKKLNQKKYRDQEKLFLVEGYHLVEEAYKSGYLKNIILLENTICSFDVPQIFVSLEVMKYLSDVDSPQNIIGVVSKIEEKEDIGNKILVLDDIQDPGNLGTIIRSSVAFGVDTIILSDKTVDLYNSKVIRSSQGMIFKINIIKKDLLEYVSKLKQEHYQILTTNVINGKNIKNLEKKEKICIIMGNEGNGVRKELTLLSDDIIYIKMNKNCESLNVGVATSIILYEIGSD